MHPIGARVDQNRRRAQWRQRPERVTVNRQAEHPASVSWSLVRDLRVWRPGDPSGRARSDTVRGAAVVG